MLTFLQERHKLKALAITYLERNQKTILTIYLSTIQILNKLHKIAQNITQC